MGDRGYRSPTSISTATVPAVPSVDERVEMLRKVWLFSECTPEELEHIAPLAERRSFDEAAEIIRQGDPGDDFYVIIDGQAVAAVDGDPIEVMGPGSFFGEISLLDGGERLATVTAKTALDVLVLTRDHFNDMLSEAMPEITPRLLQVVGERMRLLAQHEGKPVVGY
jgi:CRP-like cAMP-binding protein